MIIAPVRSLFFDTHCSIRVYTGADGIRAGGGGLGRADGGIHSAEARDTLIDAATLSMCLSTYSATSLLYLLTSFGTEDSYQNTVISCYTDFKN